MTRPGTGYRSSALLFFACAAAACGGDDGGPSDPAETGSIQVTAMTTGADLDADGYSATVDGGSSRSITSDGTTTFSGVPAGQHQVTLSGLAANCSVTGDNPVAASVSGGATASVSFQVVCNALTGFIQVSTSTSGDDLDPDGYTAALDGGPDRSIGLNGVTTFSDVTVGQHQVELTGIADNCSVDGSNPASAAVTAGETAQVSFAVACDPIPVGSLEVTTTVTNNFDPDGYEVAVASVVRGPVDVDGSTLFDDLPAGMRQVELRDIAPNCAVDGENPASVDIPVGGTGTHTFSVTCTNPPDGRIVYQGVLGGSGLGFIVMNSDGSDKLLIWECIDTCWRPKWSPDGSKIAFEMIVSNGLQSVYSLFMINQDGSGFTRLTDYVGADGNVEWSPDGSSVIFNRGAAACCDGDYGLFTMALDGSGLAALPSDAGLPYEVGPDWSPDGSKIAFVGSSGDGSPRQIFVMNADGTGTIQITPPAPTCQTGSDAGYPSWGDSKPQWSPDGTSISFSRSHYCEPEDINNAYELFVVSPDGSGAVNITNGPLWEYWQSWSPDGSRMVYDGADWSIHVINADGSGHVAIIPPSTLYRPAYPDWGP